MNFFPTTDCSGRDFRWVDSYEFKFNTSILTFAATLRGRGNVPGPITSFEHMRPTFGDTLMQELTNASFSTPSPIQKFAWPILSKGRDSVGIAQTGSGKTLAYLLPALSHITQQPDLQPGDGPIALVMGPTRELVQQIEAEAKKFGDLTGIKSAVAYGGSGERFLICLEFDVVLV